MLSLRALPLYVAALACTVAVSAPDAAAQRRRPTAPPAPPPVPAACMDFYGDTNRDWLAAHPSVRGMGVVSVLGELPQRAAQQQQEMLDALVHAPTTAAQGMLAYLWASGLDEAAIEADGSTPMAPLLARINTITRARDIAPVLAALHQVGIAAGFAFSVAAATDAIDATAPHYIVRFSEGSLGLPDPDYYLRTDADTHAIRERYLAYVQRILRLSGSAEDELDGQAQQILELETRLAAVSRPLAAMHAAGGEVTLKTRELNRRYRNLRLRAFLTTQGIAPGYVTIANPATLAELDHLVGSVPPATWKPWLRYQLAHALAPYLSSAFRDAEFELFGRILRGQATTPPRRQQVLDAINRFAGPVLAREYAARYLTTQTRDEATRIAEDIRAALRRAVERSAWLGADSKLQALAKLDALHLAIASTADADEANASDPALPILQRESFGSNILALSAWRVRARLRLLGTTHPDPDANSPAQQPVLAYARAHNRLLVSAAALQEPVWQAQDSLAERYGGYGALVAHQLSRAVDARGQEIDADGAQRAWWGEAEHAAWDALRARLIAQYGAYPVPNARGVYLNGETSVEENAADLAAVEIAFAALSAAQPELDDSSKARFFRRWAGLWREQSAPELAAWNAAIEAHAPGQWRANGPLANHPAFAATFICTPGTGMLRSAEERIAIWPQGD